MPEGYLTLTAPVVLQAVSNGYVYGFDIMDTTGLPSGTVYPALRRMQASGLIGARWEDAATAQREQRPPRKYYELTRSGTRALTDAAARYRLTGRSPARVGRTASARQER